MGAVWLIREWLGCDDEAGKRVWFAPTFFQDGTLFDIYRLKALRTGREWMHRGLRIERNDLEGAASDAVLRVHDFLKGRGDTEDAPTEIETSLTEDAMAGDVCSAEPSQQSTAEVPAIRGAPPGYHEFSSIGEFLAYLNISVPGRMSDILNRYVRDLRGDPPLDAPPLLEEAPYDPIRPMERTRGDIVSLQPTPRQELQERIRRELAAHLVVAFRASLDRHPVLRSHLDGMGTAHKEGRDVPNEAVVEDVVDFLDTTWKHHCHIRRWFLEHETSEDCYDMRNRRLRKEWRIFRDGHGKPDYDAYWELLS